MAYTHTNSKGTVYHLHAQTMTLAAGRQQVLHYFAKEVKATATPCDLPEGYEVVENPRTGLPFIKRLK
jgi:hypothetical protein